MYLCTVIVHIPSLKPLSNTHIQMCARSFILTARNERNIDVCDCFLFFFSFLYFGYSYLEFKINGFAIAHRVCNLRFTAMVYMRYLKYVFFCANESKRNEYISHGGGSGLKEKK